MYYKIISQRSTRHHENNETFYDSITLVIARIVFGLVGTISSDFFWYKIDCLRPLWCQTHMSVTHLPQPIPLERGRAGPFCWIPAEEDQDGNVPFLT